MVTLLVDLLSRQEKRFAIRFPDLFDEQTPDEVRAWCDRALRGEAFQHMRKTQDTHGAEVVYSEQYTSIRNQDGMITAGMLAILLQ